MDSATRLLIESVHRSAGKCVLAVTGAGTTAAAQLLEVPGGSRSVLEIVVPYGERSLVDFLAHQPEQFCSAGTSMDMARRAFERAAWLAPGSEVIGLGCTGSLTSARPKQGDHRVHVSYRRADTIRSFSLTLNKGARSRAEEEAVADAIIFNALAEAFALAERVNVPLLPEEKIDTQQRLPNEGRAFFQSQDQAVLVAPDGQWKAVPPEPQIGALLPGSFNPVHEGHWALAETAERILGVPVTFELSVDNADKPSLAEEEVRRRVARFAWRAPIILTRAPLFARKARLFAGAAFIVGADTAVRIIAERYYEHQQAMCAALAEIRRCGCRFLVAGRVDAAGSHIELEELPVPAEFRSLFQAIPASAFRVDVSSTELRARKCHAAEETESA